jgi:hypothetical protein
MNKYAVLGLGVLAIMAIKFKPAFEVRGIRNHNAGNIRSLSSDTWEGQVGNDGDFAIFESPEYGLRAMGRVLVNYGRIHGLNTISGIISRWAPDSENNTEAYIDSVSDALGWWSWLPLDLENPDTLRDLMKAIVKHENGVQPYSEEIYDRALAMVGESYA